MNNLVDGYWCIFCERFIEADEYGVILHDDKPHPESLTYDEDAKPQ